ncbi:MAG: hypothetical protein JWQ78_439 [Sediminibacterium sp.]|nr:hypothetical protein [Sediminibacterium sp.]
MKELIRALCFSACLLSLLVACSPSRKYTVANVHSHNDYMNDLPFTRAYRKGFGSIEADIYPVNGVLVVAHSKKEIQPQRTLKVLYIEPLLHALALDPAGHTTLLIDIKDNYALSLKLLLQEIESLRPYMIPQADKLSIVISGTRPPPSEYRNYPEYILFDDDLKLRHTESEWRRVGLVSLSFARFSEWKGETSLPREEKNTLRHTVDSVHRAGKMIRLWGAPDTRKSWATQMKLHVDFIGTDKIDELAEYVGRK